MDGEATAGPGPGSTLGKGRVGIIDVGSNSIRLVVYERASRAPLPVFNEKVLCGLARGLDATGRLNPEGVEMALANIDRFTTVAHNMKVALLDLLPTEFRLLEFLMRHTGRVLTRTMIFEAVWGYHFDPGTNVIEVHIGRLRRKLDPPEREPLIHTVRGVGYVLEAR